MQRAVFQAAFEGREKTNYFFNRLKSLKSQLSQCQKFFVSVPKQELHWLQDFNLFSIMGFVQC